jgi:transcriptional regulator with XRE-family HTH domain
MAQAIKNILRERNISKFEFAVIMGRDISEVRQWLSGTHSFNLPTLMDISLKLNLI